MIPVTHHPEFEESVDVSIAFAVVDLLKMAFPKSRIRTIEFESQLQDISSDGHHTMAVMHAGTAESNQPGGCWELTTKIRIYLISGYTLTTDGASFLRARQVNAIKRAIRASGDGTGVLYKDGSPLNEAVTQFLDIDEPLPFNKSVLATRVEVLFSSELPRISFE